MRRVSVRPTIPLGLGLAALLCACGAPKQEGTWRVMPLSRFVPHDGLAVVNQPDGYGIHIFLETDTETAGVCQPRWLPDPARLFNGNGSTPFSSGLASRQEFFEVVRRKDVTKALQQELQALCKARAPEAQWQWSEPPRSEEEVVPVALPALEEEDLLTNPVEELKRVNELLREAQQRAD